MQNSRLRLVLGALVVSLTFVFAGCGNIAEKAVEKAIEKGTGTEIDTDGDGNITIKGEDGESNFQVGDSTSVPDDFPKNVPLPKGGKLMAATTTSDVWGLTFQGVSASNYDALTSAIDAAGGNSTYSGQAEDSRQNMYELGDYDVTLFWTKSGDDTALVYSIAKKQS